MHGNLRVGMTIDGAQVNIANLTWLDLIRIAYEVKPYQTVAPARVTRGERWNIQAKLPQGSTPAQIPAMLKALLAERFKLAVHGETKEHPVYALVVGRGGAKMKPSDPSVKAETGHRRPAGVQVNAGALRRGNASGGQSFDYVGPGGHTLPHAGPAGRRQDGAKRDLRSKPDSLCQAWDLAVWVRMAPCTAEVTAHPRSRRQPRYFRAFRSSGSNWRR
jgi:uncharacterized protein (TIGR03435 family)